MTKALAASFISFKLLGIPNNSATIVCEEMLMTNCGMQGHHCKVYGQADPQDSLDYFCLHNFVITQNPEGISWGWLNGKTRFENQRKWK